MKKRLTTAQLRYSSVVRIFLLLLCLSGGGNVWADEVTFDFNGKLSTLSTVKNTSTNVESDPITLTFTSVNTSRSVEVNTDTKAIKFQGPSGDNEGTSLTVSCPTGGNFAITKVEILTENSDINKFSVSNGSYSTEGSSSSYKGTWTDGDAGNITSVTFQTTSNVNAVKSFIITYTDNRSSLTQFAFNPDEVICHGDKPAIYVNNTNLIYDANNAILKTKVIIDPAYSTAGASLNNSSFTVSSSDNTVVDATGSIAITQTNNGTRLYFDGLQVKKSGTVTLTYNFLGTETYKPSSFTQEITVIDPIDTFEGSYKYTWDFAGGNWTTSILQLGYGYSGWTKTISETASEARPSTATSISATNGIDIIKGLAFTLNNPADLCLDWFSGRKAIWIANGASVTIPNLTKDQRITITADGNNFSITSGNATVTDNVITVTGDGDVTIQMTNNTRIQSIAVSNTQYGWEYTTESATLDGTSRKIKGTFTFTEEGPIAGGTVIDEVPGITMTVGTSGTDYMVENHSQIGYAPGCIEYIFTPTVNGYLTVNMYSANSHTYIRENGNAFIDISASTYNGDYTTPNDKPLKAGNTYRLHVKTDAIYNPIYLHSFTFRPAFLNPTTNTDQLTAGDFTAHVNDPAISAFPKLIDPNSEAQQNRVKFAGDKTKVYLYKNNDVELLAAGEDILIRGTVLDKNNEDGLVAYYYLNSYVLNVSAYELEDQAYIATTGLTDDCYQFTFTGNIQPATGSTVTVLVKKDNGASENVTATITNNILYVPFASLEEGATYKMTIPENTLALTTDANTKNSEIVRTFSVNKAEELQVKMIYPTDIATVGTTIVLETYVNGSTSDLTLNDGAKVKATLSAEGETDMTIDATFSGNHLAFKPTHTLNYNKEYTLTYTYDAANNVITSKPVSDKIYKVTHDKVFTFTTGSSSGTAPVVATTSPVADDVIPGSAYSGGRISFTFDQTVDLEPYSTVTVTPVNGSEATTTASTHAPGANENTLLVDSDGKTVYFNYSADGVKYDLYYQVVIPANTVVGVGGLPNSQPITLNFRMGKNPNATEVDPDTFYPHTWDFNKFGDSDNTLSSISIIKNSTNPEIDSRNNADQPKYAAKNAFIYSSIDGGKDYLCNAKSGYGFDQGNDIYIATSTTETYKLPEFEGIRVSTKNQNMSKRFAIRWLEGEKNKDGSDKYLFRMNGNTHYMTLSNVPVGKLYMVVNSPYLGINSPNATFETVEGATISNEGTLMNTNGATKKVVINVAQAGDVSFCLQNFNCEKIAVAADTKTFKTTFVKDNKTYASDRLSYDVRYDLLNAFTSHNVKAYYVTAISDNPGVNAADIIGTQVDPANAVKADQGILAVYQGAVDANTEVPIFKADVNTAALEVTANGEVSTLKNMLKVIGNDETTFPASEEDFYNYVLAPKGTKTTGVGFYRYTGSTFSPRAAYLPIPIEYVNTGSGSSSTTSKRTRLLLLDADEQVATAILEVNDDGIAPRNNDGYYYNLNGMRVDQPKAGIYIRNGKKVVMK